MPSLCAVGRAVAGSGRVPPAGDARERPDRAGLWRPRLGDKRWPLLGARQGAGAAGGEGERPSRKARGAPHRPDPRSPRWARSRSLSAGRRGASPRFPWVHDLFFFSRPIPLACSYFLTSSWTFKIWGKKKKTDQTTKRNP